MLSENIEWGGSLNPHLGFQPSPPDNFLPPATLNLAQLFMDSGSAGVLEVIWREGPTYTALRRPSPMLRVECFNEKNYWGIIHISTNEPNEVFGSPSLVVWNHFFCLRLARCLKWTDICLLLPRKKKATHHPGILAIISRKPSSPFKQYGCS